MDHNKNRSSSYKPDLEGFDSSSSDTSPQTSKGKKIVCIPGFGDGGGLNTTVIIFLVAVGVMLGLLQYYLDESKIFNPEGFPPNSVNECYSTFAVVNSVFMVVIAAISVAINIFFGEHLGRDFLEHYKGDGDVSIKESIEKICNNAGLMNALIFACVVQMCITTPPNNPCGCYSQIYINLCFNALGTSFYGIISSVAPMMYISGLNELQAKEYMTVRNNIRGLGAAVASIANAGWQLVMAVIVYSWSLYGQPLGVGMVFGIAFLFIGGVNRFAFQSRWSPSDTGESASLAGIVEREIGIRNRSATAGGKEEATSFVRNPALTKGRK